MSGAVEVLGGSAIASGSPDSRLVDRRGEKDAVR